MTHTIKPAIVIAGYKRVNSIVRLMKCVSEAYYDDDDITLVVSIDHSEMENNIIDEVKRIGWKHGTMKIRTFDERLGLRKHILMCGDLTEQYGAIIVLEDDLFVSKNYYSYTQQMLNAFRDDDRICGVSLYCHSWNGYGNYQFIPQRNEYDVFIGQIGIPWGQCWTRNQWSEFKIWYENNKEKEIFDNNLPFTINEWGNQSWAKYFYNYMVEREKYYILPYTSLSTNFSEVGEHSVDISLDYQVPILDAEVKNYIIPKFDEAVKYDMFFERIMDGMVISGVNGEDICVNLNGFKNSLFGKKYLLTCKRINGIKPISSYGLFLRPIEENVIKNIQGNDIYLYNADALKKSEIQNYRRTSLKRIRYEIYGNPKKRLVDYLAHNDMGDSIHSIIDIWDGETDYERIQNRIESVVGSSPSTGTTWMFHNVSPKDEWDDPEYCISPLSFEGLIKYRLDGNYSFGNIIDVINNKDDRTIYLTFDDGYKGVYKYILPLCQKYNIPFCVFITVDYIGQPNYLNAEEIKELNECELCTIGSHSLSHKKMRFLSTDEKKKELIYSKYILEGILQTEIQLFAYPFGSVYAVDKDSIMLAGETGYEMAFATISAHNSEICDMRYFMPRININEKVAYEMINSII